MAKSKKRKETEYAVKYLHESQKLDAKKIALELGIAEAVVDGILSKIKEPEPKRISKSQNLMIRQTSNKKTSNVSIMTEAASQINDEFKKKLGTTSSRTSKNAIFRPND